MTTVTQPPVSARHIDTPEAAKLIRKALKAAFPATKFSVRSQRYSGGSSIDVRWTDGPSGKAVKAITDQFQGSGFDSMIDLKYSLTHWLMPDGSVIVADNPGTEGSAGVHPKQSNPKPDPKAELVRFGSDFVFCERELTEQWIDKCSEAWAELSVTEQVALLNNVDFPRYKHWHCGAEVENYGKNLATFLSVPVGG